MAPKNGKGASPAKLEANLLGILEDSFHRAECAAKAAARIENQIVELHVEEQAEPTTDAEEIDEEHAASSSREFDTSKFLQLFERLNYLKTAEDVIKLMGLRVLEEDIMKLLTTTELRPRGATAGAQKAAQPEQFVGTQEEYMMKLLRDDAERKSRQKARAGN